MEEKKSMEEKQSFITKHKKELIISGLALLIVIGISFAYLTQTLISTRNNVIVSGKLQLSLGDEQPIIKIGGDTGYAEPMLDSTGLTGTPYTFTITNTGTEEATYTIYLDNVDSYKNSNNQTVNITNSTRISDKKIDYNLRVGNSDTNTTVTSLNSIGRGTETNPRILVINDTLSAGGTRNYTLRLWIDSSATNTDTQGKVFAGKIRIEATQASRNETINSHINAVYKYNEHGSGTGASFTGCLGGAESGCSDIKSTLSKISTYPIGTVIKYEVSEGVYKYFNVIKDNGETLTLQERQNTVSSKAWYGTSSDYTNVNGPATTSGYVLYELEQATSSWTNVNDQTYSIGDNNTTLGYSGCSSYNSCAVSKYTLTREAKKARMITIQETNNVGCTQSNMSCPKFINNYLGSSLQYGGTFASGNAYYWTMSAYSGSSTYAWNVSYYGYVGYGSAYATNFGARAVVVINK